MHTSTANIFRALRLVSSAGHPLGVTEVSRRLGLPISSAHRALATLERTGYVRRAPNSAFEPGPRVERLIVALLRNFALREASAPYLQQIATASGHTTSICVQVGWYSVRLASIRGEVSAVRRAGRLAGPILIHKDLGAWAVFAGLDESERGAFLSFVRRHKAAQLPQAKLALAQVSKARREWVISRRPKEGFYTVSFALRGAQNGMAAIAVEGFGADEPQSQLAKRVAEWAQLVQRLEALVRANPEKFAHPFAHIPRADIVFP